LRLKYAGKLPVPQNPPRPRRAALEERNFVNRVRDEYAGVVEIGSPPISAIVVSVREDVRQRRRIVFRLRERVRDSEVQVYGEAALDAHLESVVGRQTGILGETQDSKADKRTQRIGVHTGVRLDRPWL